MTSSKFSVRPPPFKVPAICKKAIEGPPPPIGNPLPQDPTEGFYVIHGTLFGTRWDREGSLMMAKQSPIRWESPIPPDDPDGEVIVMNWNESTPAYSGSVLLYVAGILRAILNKGATSYSWVDDFDTGMFDWENIFFIGQQEGRYANPA